MGLELERGDALLRAIDPFIDRPHMERVNRYVQLRGQRNTFWLNKLKEAYHQKVTKTVEPLKEKEEIELYLNKMHMISVDEENEARWRRCDIVQTLVEVEAVEVEPRTDTIELGETVCQQTLKIEEVIDATDSGPGAQSTQGVLVGV